MELTNLRGLIVNDPVAVAATNQNEVFSPFRPEWSALFTTRSVQMKLGQMRWNESRCVIWTHLRTTVLKMNTLFAVSRFQSRIMRGKNELHRQQSCRTVSVDTLSYDEVTGTVINLW